MLENQVAIKGIRQILRDSWQLHGWCCPDYVTDYVTRILASKIDKNPWQPEPSYAERYLQLKNPAEALDLGNTCFFTRSVFPDIGTRRGISPNYYVQLGQGCYDYYLSYATLPAIQMLNQHFEFLAEMTYTAVRSQGQLREMWDL